MNECSSDEEPLKYTVADTRAIPDNLPDCTNNLTKITYKSVINFLKVAFMFSMPTSAQGQNPERLRREAPRTHPEGTLARAAY
jgi:hypothetical protein